MTYRTVVTGASSGIGRAVAMTLARDRHALVLNARNERELNRLAEACLEAGAVSVSVVAGDVCSPDTGSWLAESVENSGSGEVVLFNNAGVAAFGPFHQQDIEVAASMVEVMLVGAMRAAHALLPIMVAQQAGTIINVASIAAKHAFPNSQAYCAAKAGLLAFSNCLALDYRAQGVRVTCLVPGAVDTPLWNPMAIHPPREDMVPVSAIAETVKYIVDMPRDRVIDEIVVMPPKGIL